MAKRVRLSDIAERLNLSVVSVSKALRNHPDISTETRDLIRKTAREMGYLPNHLARSLSSKRSNTLGVVIPRIAHSFFAAVLEGIYERAREYDQRIVLTISHESAQMEQQNIEMLLGMHVDGLLVSVSQEPDADHAIYHRIKDLGVPLVFFDRSVEGLGFSSVTVDDYQGAFNAVEYAIREGYRKFAHIAGYAHTNIGRDRRRGYEDALRKYNIPVYDKWILEGGFGEKDGAGALQKILSQEELPEVIFSASFAAGLGVYAAMREADPDLINRIRLITFGDSEFNRFFPYNHIFVHQPGREMGRQSVSLLLDEINNPTTSSPVHIILDTPIVTPALPLDTKVRWRSVPVASNGAMEIVD